MWDFDCAFATSHIDPAKMFGKPIRAYAQGGGAAAPAAGSVHINAQSSRWRDYVERATTGAPKEVPPLPPEATNSNADPSKNGHDTPRGAGLPSANYTHHLIRDFMFLDAAAANQPASGATPPLAPLVARQFTARFKPLNPVGLEPALKEFTRGTGRQQAINKHLIDRASVTPSGNSVFSYLHDTVSFRTLLYELLDLQNSPVNGNSVSPNWFGVTVPDGITDFTNVVIYFHPTPLQAGYEDSDYQNKDNGGNPNHTNWKELLGYVDRLGSQLAGAVKHAAATPNQVVIVPLMRQANRSNAGILPGQWLHIVNDILKDLPTRLPTL